MDFYEWLDHNSTSEGSIVLYYLCKVSKKYILIYPLINFKSFKISKKILEIKNKPNQKKILFFK